MNDSLNDGTCRKLLDVYGNVEAYGSDAALAWFQEPEKAIYSLQRYPERGTRENKKHWILFFGRKPNIYKVIYKVDRQDAEVKVFHIRHGRPPWIQAMNCPRK